MTSLAVDVAVLQTLESHTSDVTCCDFGGNFYLASASGDKSVRVWEWKPGFGYVETSYSPLQCHKYGVTHLRFSPQGTMLATASIDGSTVLFNVKTGSKVCTFVQANGGAVRVCRFTPDSTIVATAGDDGTVCVWDVVHRSLIRSFQEHEGTILAIAFTPDSSCLVTTCTQGVMKLWDVTYGHGTCLFTKDDAHDLGVTSCDFSNSFDVVDHAGITRKFLLATGGNDQLVKFWIVTVGLEDNIMIHMVLEGHSSAVTCVRFSQSGMLLASGAVDKTIRIWETEGRCLKVLEGHSRYVTSCCFSRDGSLLATGSNDKCLKVWDLTGHVTIDSELVKSCSALSHFGNKDRDEEDHCCKFQEQEFVKQAEVEDNEVKLLQRLSHEGASVNSCHFYGKDLLATGAGDKMVRLWERNSEGRFKRKQNSPYEGHRYTVNHVEFSPCGTLLASCSIDGTTILWDVETGKRGRPSFQCTGGGLRVCRFSPDTHLLVTGGDDEKACVWNTKNLELLMSVEEHKDAIATAAFTPDSQYLVTACSQGIFKMWCVSPCSEECLITQEEAHDLGVQSCDFSPAEGTAVSARGLKYRYLLATCGNDSLVKLWHLSIQPEGQCRLVRSLEGHGGNVQCVRFAPSGEIVASTATDKTARLWNVYSGECVFVLENHDSFVTTCAFSADSSLIATGSLDKNVLVWELPAHIVFRTMAAERLRGYQIRVMDWTTEDIEKWLNMFDITDMGEKLKNHNIKGQDLLNLPEENLFNMLEIEDEEKRKVLFQQLYWLKKENQGFPEVQCEIPHAFLCPITHEIMRDPVISADGFTYERAAINEWFLSGKFTSPMTNMTLSDTKCVPNVALKTHIYQFLYGDAP